MAKELCECCKINQASIGDLCDPCWQDMEILEDEEEN